MLTRVSSSTKHEDLNLGNSLFLLVPGRQVIWVRNWRSLWTTFEFVLLQKTRRSRVFISPDAASADACWLLRYCCGYGDVLLSARQFQSGSVFTVVSRVLRAALKRRVNGRALPGRVCLDHDIALQAPKICPILTYVHHSGRSVGWRAHFCF